ncbi:MAG: proton-conducting transporter membrane subunit, partial [Spirochaeta sp.]|jgi:formate hydrogenlyase subunit 3/multisubunit Na+/H+ antiporter MnhD subunit|nr:proton-conducting transporter membrane subunit [Spirochaeta sp.]
MAMLVLTVAGLSAAVAAGFSPVSVAIVPVIAILGVLDAIRLPTRVQVLVVLAGMGAFLGITLPEMNGVSALFAAMFGVGGSVQLIAFLHRRERAPGLIPLVAGLILSLTALTMIAPVAVSGSGLELFFVWELMTITSFLLVLRGARGTAAGLRYIVFSLAAAYLMLASFAVPGHPLTGGVTASGSVAVWSTVLFVVALLVKLGTAGVHIWLPATYAEAEDDVSSLMSSVLSKAGIFLLFLAGTALIVPIVRTVPLMTIVGWLGVITAVVGAMMALFQEDIKYTLAYSSMSQIGYIVLAFAAMTHLGWVGGLYLSVTHLLFKAMLFLAIAGVVYRTGTRLMYRMGGLIKRMPWTFVSVLIGIIAVSGVPPLSGFGGKWLLYTALFERGWYLQAALALFSSGVAFLYLFRLIHSIFLGQRSAVHDEVREAPVWFLIPQFIFIGAIMAISMFPNLILHPLQSVVEPVFASTVRWEGYSVISSLGYWNGNAVMYVTMGVFLGPLLWLLIVKGRVYRVEQFNIVYAAERPHTPETTHYAYNFFGHYRKAFGRLLDPWVERFWGGTVAAAASLSRGLRGWNTGNPQTYALQIVLYVLLITFVARGGL